MESREVLQAFYRFTQYGGCFSHKALAALGRTNENHRMDWQHELGIDGDLLPDLSQWAARRRGRLPSAAFHLISLDFQRFPGADGL